MSHVTKYEMEIKDINLFCEKAKQLGYTVFQGDRIETLFSRQVNCIASVKVEGWKYPLAITEKGEVLYDHFGSKPGSMEKFHSLVQEYNEELVMQNLPMDMIHNHYTEKVEDGRKLVLEYE